MKSKLGIILVVLVLLSCGEDDGSVKIKFWAFGGTDNHMEWAKERVDEFNRTHPDVTVIKSQKSWNMIRELLFTNFSAGTGPDVMRVHANYSAEFGEAGYFLPINQFPDYDEVKKWYEPNSFNATLYKDRSYGLPLAAIAFTLICNKDLFDQENLQPPKTWSEFRSIAKKFTKDTDGDGKIDQWGLTLLGGDRGGFSYRLAPFIFKAGGKIISDDFKKVEFNNEIGQKAVQLFADMYQIDKSITPGFLAYTISEINDLHCNNKIAMSIDGPWFPNIIHEKLPNKEIITVPIPVPDELIDKYDSMPTLQDMVMLAINAKTKHPEATWEFVKFMRNADADMAWVTRDMGAIAVTNDALNSPEAEKMPRMPVYRNELKYASPWPAHPGIIAIIRNVMAPYGQQAIIGEMSVKEALDKAAEKAELILKGEL